MDFQQADGYNYDKGDYYHHLPEQRRYLQIVVTSQAGHGLPYGLYYLLYLLRNESLHAQNGNHCLDNDYNLCREYFQKGKLQLTYVDACQSDNYQTGTAFVGGHCPNDTVMHCCHIADDYMYSALIYLRGY